MNKLKRATALVAGGATGLGKAFAETLLEQGAKVIIMDANAFELQRTAAAFHAKYGVSRVCSLVQDTATPEAFVRAFEVAAISFDNAVNVVVNDTGISSHISHFDCNTPHSWESVVAVDSIALMRTTLEAAEQMESSLSSGEEGVIVNLAMVGGLVDMPFWPAYATAKAGVLAFTRSMRSLKACRNIRVMTLCLGFVDTAIGHFVTDAFPGAMRDRCGLVPVETLTKAFVRAVEDEHNAGRCMVVLEGQAIYYEADFTDSTLTFPTWRSQITN
ncbi:15-hydroxyprostaglandin dehydrogenase [Phytophthora cinnamomi]|uniref:15-hydroxyprostaglandin dehydrogenase n=1 Tax=Phytophthora cinnamomi TaxID=4785 RepID=UPI00355A8EE0|nr:15-hydroxyprostaglandin dehydrogenase [Phytophthora cinnamomi]